MPSSPGGLLRSSGNRILAVALVAGVLGDALFHGASLGVNVPLWLGTLLLAAWALRRPGTDDASQLRWLVVLALFFAGCVAWRASPFLRFWNGAAVLAAVVTMTVQLRGQVARAWLEDYVRAAADLVGHLAGGTALVLGEVRLPALGTAAFGTRVRASGIGMVLAVPVVFVFGALLVSADPLFEAFVRKLFTWDLRPLLEHGLLIALLAWITAGWLRSMTVHRERRDGSPLRPPVTLGAIPLAIPLGTLTLLLAAFIGLQTRYLFGGETVLHATGLTYAEFARRGFFELVLLSALVVPLVYAAQWVLDRSSRSAQESFRALTVALCLLVGLVMVSAVARMRLYVAAYGLTEDRLYATAFMLWIGWVLAWFAVTELRTLPARFATGAVVAGFVVLAVLNLLNPDRFIARTNLARAASGEELDAEYLKRLSADAVPAIAAAWPDLDARTRCQLQAGILSGVRPMEDWREWTWAATAARRAMRGVRVERSCT